VEGSVFRTWAKGVWMGTQPAGRTPGPVTDVTFLLSSGGHNAGIVRPPGHPRRSNQIGNHRGGQPHLDPDTWQDATPVHQVSWWPAWQAWLQERSSEQVPPPAIGAPGSVSHLLQTHPVDVHGH
jgi:polyhydroxyalkanoate synthase subunit PhaC